MKALLLWADGSSPNLGVRALAEGTKSLLERAWPEITVETLDDVAVETGFNLSGRFVLQDLIRRNGPLRSLFREYDLIVDTGGGDSFADIYGVKRLIIMAYAHEAAFHVRTRVVFGPQTIGPFNNWFSRVIARRMLSRAAMVVSRDPVSTRLVESLGQNVDLTATDVVFALPHAEARTVRDIVINVSGLLWDQNPHVDHLEYRRSVEKLVEELLSQGREVTFLPHVLDNDYVDSDTRILNQLESIFGEKVTVVRPTGLVDVRETLSGAQLVIGARMHACLNALSVGTPAIAWAYSRKFEPLMRELGWNHIVDLRSSEDPVLATLSVVERLPELVAEADAVRGRADTILDTVVSGLRAKGMNR